MEHNDLMDILVLLKKMHGRLGEVLDLTGQLAEAVDRRDQVSVQMLVSMRQEPIEQLGLARKNLDARLGRLDGADCAYVRSLLEQENALEQEPLGKLLREQAAANRRLLERVVELDSRVNQKLGGADSYYNTGS